MYLISFLNMFYEFGVLRKVCKYRYIFPWNFQNNDRSIYLKTNKHNIFQSIYRSRSIEIVYIRLQPFSLLDQNCSNTSIITRNPKYVIFFWLDISYRFLIISLKDNCEPTYHKTLYVFNIILWRMFFID